ncbi:MAG: 23S rRNA (adenine(2030)-N(6))-methyltransferase RlmJ, partial [Gammaproteobacteria bacterium]
PLLGMRDYFSAKTSRSNITPCGINAMNYRHVYHAGNFMDVVKHVTLIALISSLFRKETPFCYIDTHAGTGYYDLLSASATKTKEYVGGIEKIIHAEHVPALVQRYLECVHHINNRLSSANYAALHYYPGSPMIARHFARPHDRIIACELQPEDCRELKNTFAGDTQVAIHHLDGFLGLKAFLPPHERRGLVLIDPPYEDPDEFSRIAKSLPIALKRWETGIYGIWYPIKEKRQVERFYRSIRQTLSQPILIIELTIYPDLPSHLNGCGMAIINPPWQFEQTMQPVLSWLWKTLAIDQQGGYKAYLLK